MKARGGQVAVYLVLVLVALAVLMLMNVSVFLAVRSKNRLMNAVDASAVAVAKHQGELLNRLGALNVEHLRSLVANRPWEHEKIAEMRELAMFAPLDGLEIANRVAIAWGFENDADGEMVRVIRRHLDEIVNEYCNSPDLYPEYREGQWADYAARLAAHLGEGLAVAPGFMETANAWSQMPLLSEAFYDAIAAKAWCWFGQHGRERFLEMDSKSMPRPEFGDPDVQVNSEIYSLHVTFGTWLDSGWADEYVDGVGFSERWTNFVCQVTGCTRGELAASTRAADLGETWVFYDDNWRSWSLTFNPDAFPIAGAVRPEYDVAGCVASCLMLGKMARLLDEDADESSVLVTAEAKPLGTVTFEGETLPVTAFHSFIAPSRPGGKIFTEAQLVLMNSVPRSPGVSLSPRWYEHVTSHLPAYFANGPDGASGCYYCRQLEQWEKPEFRTAARDWLTANAGSCEIGGGSGGGRGGYDCAH